MSKTSLYSVLTICLLPFYSIAADVCNTNGASTNFENAANNLQPNSWCEYTTSNYSKDLVKQGAGDVLAFAARMSWDPNENKIWFMGQTHGPQKMQTLEYDSAQDMWFREEVSQFQSGHAYDGITLDSRRRHLWYKHFNQRKFYRMDLASGNWDNDIKFQMGDDTIAYGAAVFPDFLGEDYMFNYNSYRGLSITSLDNYQDQTIPLYTAGKKSKNKDITTGHNHIFIFHDPASEALYFGGGSSNPDMDERAIYRVTKTNQLSRLDNLPSSYQVGSGGRKGKICSGGNRKLYIFGPEAANGEAYELDPDATAGTQLKRLPDMPISAPILCTSISEFNVIAVNSDDTFLLYKPPTDCNNCPTVDNLPPQAPASLDVQE